MFYAVNQLLTGYTFIAVTNCAGCVHCAHPWAQPCGRLAPCKSAILPICLACLLAADGHVLPQPELQLCFRSPYQVRGRLRRPPTAKIRRDHRIHWCNMRASCSESISTTIHLCYFGKQRKSAVELVTVLPVYISFFGEVIQYLIG